LGCSREQHELKLDPGVSPFYPGETATGGARPQAGIDGRKASVAAEGPNKAQNPADSQPLNTALGANEVERRVRMAALTAERGDTAAATLMLEKVLAVEPINREALYYRAKLALDAYQRGKALPERLAAVAKAGELAQAIVRTNEMLRPREVELLARVLYAQVEAHVLEGTNDKALAAIMKAHDLGFNVVKRLETDPAMAKLRESPQYRATLKAIDESRLAQARSHVHETLEKPLAFSFDFSLPDPDGKKLALSELEGKVVLVDVWGTWCQPCRQSIPHLIKLFHEFHPKGLEIVGLNYEHDVASDSEGRALVREGVKRLGIPYPCLIGDEATLKRVPGFAAFPTALLLDRSLRPRMLVVGYDEKALDRISNAVLVLLNEPALVPPTKNAKGKR
jgi:thiol-disulfide isomerase/thioredoxin